MSTGLLLPDVDDITSGPFWSGTAAGELLVQSCAVCGRWRMPPRPMCPHCRSLAASWVPTSGRATIWSFVVAHPPLLAAYEDFAPYNVIVVALDEEPTIRLVGNLVRSAEGAIDEIDPATITIGEPVTVVFATVDDVTLPRWTRA